MHTPTATLNVESSDQLHNASHADLVKGCQYANKELQQHRRYLDQLLTIVIDKHPEILTMVTEAQKMKLVSFAILFFNFFILWLSFRDLVESESWC